MLRFLVLLLPAWWLWIDFSYYFDQFGDTDNTTRFCLFLSMFLILYLGLLLPQLQTKPQYFNIVYLMQRALLTFLYARAWGLVPEARAVTKRYTTSFSISLLLWVIALFFDGGIKQTIWMLALMLEIFNGPITYATVRDVPRFQSHMPERFGLFLIIVLGETILSVASGLGQVAVGAGSVAVAALGFLVGLNMWWLYFSKVNAGEITRALQGNARTLLRSYVYGYGHFFVYGGIGITGAGILFLFHSFSHPHLATRERLVLCCGVSLYTAALYVVQWATRQTGSRTYLLLNGFVLAALLALVPLGDVLSPIVVLTIVCLLLSLLSLYRWRLERCRL